jgi:hypothetical protein
MKKNLNEEQLAQAVKEARGNGNFRFPVYLVKTLEQVTSSVKITKQAVFIEAERWVDARSFAIRLLGVGEVEIELAKEQDALPRHQVQWRREAMTGTLRMQSRLVTKPTGQTEPGGPYEFYGVHWKDV